MSWRVLLLLHSIRFLKELGSPRTADVLPRIASMYAIGLCQLLYSPHSLSVGSSLYCCLLILQERVSSHTWCCWCCCRAAALPAAAPFLLYSAAFPKSKLPASSREPEHHLANTPPAGTMLGGPACALGALVLACSARGGDGFAGPIAGLCDNVIYVVRTYLEVYLPCTGGGGGSISRHTYVRYPL